MVASGQCFQALKGESLMKKPYQIAAGRAVQRGRQGAEEKNPVAQFRLALVEILTLAKQGAGELMREAGLKLILLAMGQEIEALSGPRYQRSAGRQAQRWSREDGFVVIDGQKVPIERRRLQGKDGGEVRLGTYEMFQQTRPARLPQRIPLMLTYRITFKGELSSAFCTPRAPQTIRPGGRSDEPRLAFREEKSSCRGRVLG